MNTRLANSLLFCALLLSGCGSNGPNMPPPHMTEIGQMAKNQVSELVETAKARPAAAASQLNLLLESLDSYAVDHGGAFVELRDTAKELQEIYQRKAPKQEIDRQLDKLARQAAALPN